MRKLNRGGRHSRSCLGTLGGLALMLAASPAFGQTADLTQMSLEDLMNLEVTSVSRRSQRLGDAAAAIYVLTSEDLRRSGARTIPDALRLVPGLHVGQIDSNKWSVSVRGFGGRFSNKLQVLVDGRSVYTPMFSGVFWSVVDVPVDDIERIEIVRGPGATLWGANAVNGVINIITRSAAASQGIHVTVGTGTEDRGFGSFRYGGTIANNTSYRLDFGASQIDPSGQVGAVESIDQWDRTRFGFRMMSEVAANQEIRVEAAYTASEADDAWLNPSLQSPYRLVEINRARYTSGFLSGDWTRRFDTGSTTVKFLEERGLIDELRFDERRHTVAVEFQHTERAGSSREWVAGGTFRSSTDETTPGLILSLMPSARRLREWSVFAQNEWLIQEGLRVTLGTKFEHNDYTGWEFQPNVRVLVSMSPTQSLWGAVSRAVRLPSRAESDAQVLYAVMPPSAASPLPQRIVLMHDSATPRSEELLAYEGGYRLQPTDSLSLDISGYHNRYDSLIVGGGQGMPSISLDPTPHVTVPVYHGNLGRQNLSGAEVAFDWRPSPRARFGAAYSWFREGDFTATGLESDELIPITGGYPTRQGFVRGAFNLPGRVELDLAARHVGALANQEVPSYITADARVGFRFGQLDLSLIGRNLLQSNHVEFLPDLLNTASTQVERAVAIRLTWKR